MTKEKVEPVHIEEIAERVVGRIADRLYAAANNSHVFASLFAATLHSTAGEAQDNGLEVNALELLSVVGRAVFQGAPEELSSKKKPKPKAAEIGLAGDLGTLETPVVPNTDPNSGTGGAPLPPDPNAPPPPPAAEPKTSDELAAEGKNPDGSDMTAKQRKKAGLPPLDDDSKGAP